MEPLTPEQLLKLMQGKSFDEGMGDSVQARSELPPPYAPANPTYAPPQGMAESLRPRAELTQNSDDITPVDRRPASMPAPASPSKVPFEDLQYNSLDRLKAAQDAARGNALNVNMLNAGQGLNEVLNRTQFDRHVNDSLAKTVDQPIDFYKQHEVAQKSDLDVLKDMYKNSTSQHLRDPNSDISNATRSLFGKMGVKLDPGTSAMDIEASDNLSKLLGIREQAEARKQAALLANQGRLDRERDKKDEQNNRHIEGLSKRLEAGGLSELDPVIANIQKDIKLNGNDDIPGFGQTGGFPDFLITDKGKSARQAVQSLHNILLKARSGGAVTPQEAVRYAQELGIGANKTDEQLRQGIKNTIDFLGAKKKAVLSGYQPEILNEFAKRGGNVNIPSYGGTQGGGEEKRRTQDGRTAVFDSATKQFLRYE